MRVCVVSGDLRPERVSLFPSFAFLMRSADFALTLPHFVTTAMEIAKTVKCVCPPSLFEGWAR